MAFVIERVDAEAAQVKISQILNEGVPTDETIQTGGFRIKIGNRTIGVGTKQHIVVDHDSY